MKICFLANSSSIHTQRFARYFADKGHEVHIISFADECPAKSLDGITIHPINANKRYIYATFPMEFLKFKKVVDQIRPDIIHAHYVTKYGIIGSLLTGYPFMVSAWGSDIWEDSKGWLRLPTKYVLKKADAVHCDSGKMLGELAVLGAAPSKTHLVYFGTDTKNYHKRGKSRELAEKLGVYGSPVVISTRGLDPVYDVGTFITAIPMVLKEVPDAKFIILGKGSTEAALKSRVESLGLSERVRFYGRIPNDLVPDYLSLSDVYVSTSLSDGGLAASTAEAMACEVPCIITDFGDNSKWVKDGVNGFIVPVRSPEQVADKIIYLLKNKKISEQFGMLSRQIIEEGNDYYKEMAKIENIYYRLLKNN